MKAVFIPCCLLLSVLCLALDSVIILEERCHSEIAVSAAVKVTVSNWTALREISTCTVNITTTRDREEPTTQLMFLLLDMHSPSSNCSEVRLDIVDSDGTSLTPKNGFCENSQNSKQFVSSKPKATISLKSNATSHDSSFLMLIVKFHMQPCDDSNEFECDNNRCVPSNLKCDGDNNCGDNSDETDGCLMSMTVIIIIVVSTVALAITMILISVAVYRRYTGRKVWWGDPRLLAGATSINQDTSYEQADTKKQVPCYGTTDQTST